MIRFMRWRLMMFPHDVPTDAEAFADEGLQAFRDTPEEESYAAPLIKAFTKAAKVCSVPRFGVVLAGERKPIDGRAWAVG